MGSSNTFLNRSVKEDPGASPSLATGVSHSSSSSPVPAGRPRNHGTHLGPRSFPGTGQLLGCLQVGVSTDVP